MINFLADDDQNSILLEKYADGRDKKYEYIMVAVKCRDADLDFAKLVCGVEPILHTHGLFDSIKSGIHREKTSLEEFVDLVRKYPCLIFKCKNHVLINTFDDAIPEIDEISAGTVKRFFPQGFFSEKSQVKSYARNVAPIIMGFVGFLSFLVWHNIISIQQSLIYFCVGLLCSLWIWFK